MAVLGGAALVAGILFVSPAQAALSCQSVPGQTIGADVKVGPAEQRIPAIGNIKLCYGTGTAPVASVTTSGGTCTSSCLTVAIGGGNVDLEGATVSWTEDGVARTQALDPAPVEGAEETCVISTGIPDAPNPGCFIAVGVDDPTGATAPVVQTVDQAEDLVLDAAGDAVGITCSLIPDRSGYDFCTDPTGWTNATAGFAYDRACSAVPDAHDGWYSYDFCSDPIGWTLALTRGATESVCWTMGDAHDPQTGRWYYFCDDPVGWTRAVFNTLCGNVCDRIVVDDLLDAIQRAMEENIAVHIG